MSKKAKKNRAQQWPLNYSVPIYEYMYIYDPYKIIVVPIMSIDFFYIRFASQKVDYMYVRAIACGRSYKEMIRHRISCYICFGIAASLGFLL